MALVGSKKHVVSLMLLVLAATTWSVIWYNHATEMRLQLVQRLDQLVSQQHLSYDAVELHGFPLRVKLDVIRPEFRYDAGKWLRAQLDEPAQADMPPLLWTQSIQLTEPLSLEYHLLTTSGSLETKGLIHIRDQFGQFHNHFVVELSDPLHIGMDIPLKTILQVLTQPDQLVATDPRRWLRQVRALSLRSGALELRDAATGQKLATSSPMHSTFRHSGIDRNGNISLQFSFFNEALVFLPGFASHILTNPYLRVLGRHHMIDVTAWEKRGASYTDIKGVFEGRLLGDGREDRSFDGTLRIDHAKLGSLFGTTEGTLELSLKREDETMRHLQLRTHAKLNYTEAWHRWISGFLQNDTLLDHFQASLNRNAASKPFPATLLAQLDDIGQFLVALVPKLHENSPVQITAHIDYQGADGEEKERLSVDRLAIATANYGMDIQSTTAGDPANESDKTTITLTQYDRLVEALGDYINNLTVTATSSLTPQAVQIMSPQLLAEITRTLEAVADQREEDGTLILTIRKDQDGMRVGSLTQAELTTLQDRITPHFFSAFMQLQSAILSGSNPQ